MNDLILPKDRLKRRGKPRTFLTRTTYKNGGSRVISISRILPDDWQYVNVIVLSRNSRQVLLQIDLVGITTDIEPDFTEDEKGFEALKAQKKHQNDTDNLLKKG